MNTEGVQTWCLARQAPLRPSLLESPFHLILFSTSAMELTPGAVLVDRLLSYSPESSEGERWAGVALCLLLKGIQAA